MASGTITRALMPRIIISIVKQMVYTLYYMQQLKESDFVSKVLPASTLEPFRTSVQALYFVTVPLDVVITAA